jgi:trehalose/maltose hydrolase-like predicted phosphorylase
VSDFLFDFDGFDPDEEGHREALCTLGNGYFATRGAWPEAIADGVHYPGSYIAGVYNRLSTTVAGHQVANESLVNAPNWLVLRFRAENGPWFDPGACEILDHHVQLDMRRGTLTRRSRLRDPDGRIVAVTQRRFVSMRDAHLAGLETTLVAENWSGRLCVRSGLDGTVTNSGVARYEGLPDRHLRTLGIDQESDELICLHTETNQSHIRIAQATRTRVFRNGDRPPVHTTLVQDDDFVAFDLTVDVTEGEATTVEKIASLFTSRDHGISEPGEEACARLMRMPESFEVLLDRHVVSWRQLWDRVRLELGTDGDVARLLHFHTFHVLQTVSNNSIGLDVGVPARGLHGEAYRGHIFWDELFIVPFLNLRIPSSHGSCCSTDTVVSTRRD